MYFSMVIQPVLRSINIKCHMTIHMLLDSKTLLARLPLLLLLSVFHAIFSFYLNHHLIYFIFKITMTHYACITMRVSGISSCLIGSHCIIHTSTDILYHTAINLVSSSLFLDPHELKRQNLLLQNIDRY